MKHLFVLMIAMTASITSFAAKLSDFERGYNEGKQSCGNELWVCEATEPNCIVWSAATGFSRAQALMKLSKQSDYCNEAVVNKKFVCTKR